jgi:two-component system, LytTR family, response regulator
MGYQVYTAMIVDDEQDSIDLLTDLLKEFPEIHLTGTYRDPEMGIAAIISNKPDLLFLDIEMPVMDGFGVVREIREKEIFPEIIFVTAYNKYAIEAIRHAAFDFLVKPVSASELKNCITRCIEKKPVSDMRRQIDELLHTLKHPKLCFNTRTGNIFIDPDKIVYLEADGNYTDFILDNHTRQTITQNISAVEPLLDRNDFQRISRSAIIHRKYLHEINRKEKKCILLANGKVYSPALKTRYLPELLGNNH